LKVSP